MLGPSTGSGHRRAWPFDRLKGTGNEAQTRSPGVASAAVFEGFVESMVEAGDLELFVRRGGRCSARTLRTVTAYVGDWHRVAPLLVAVGRPGSVSISRLRPLGQARPAR